MLKIENLTFAYSRRRPPVLDDFSLEVSPGKVYGLLGPNGAGKSTLLYLIMGLLYPQRGRVEFRGVDTRRRGAAALADMFIVPEEFTLPPIEFDKFVRTNAQFYPRFSQVDLMRHLSTFGLDYAVNLGSLSMGQKKKAFMCFALAANTSLLLMDEPTNGLDIPGKSSFRRFVASSMTDDRTIVISTHQVRDIDRLLDHVIIMNNHSVLLDRSIGEISERLDFTRTDDKIVADRALFAQPSLGGFDVVLPNMRSEAETEVNLETLFELALANPVLLKSQFTTDDNGKE